MTTVSIDQVKILFEGCNSYDTQYLPTFKKILHCLNSDNAIDIVVQFKNYRNVFPFVNSTAKIKHIKSLRDKMIQKQIIPSGHYDISNADRGSTVKTINIPNSGYGRKPDSIESESRVDNNATDGESTLDDFETKEMHEAEVWQNHDMTFNPQSEQCDEQCDEQQKSCSSEEESDESISGIEIDIEDVEDKYARTIVKLRNDVALYKKAFGIIKKQCWNALPAEVTLQLLEIFEHNK